MKNKTSYQHSSKAKPIFILDLNRKPKRVFMQNMFIKFIFLVYSLLLTSQFCHAENVTGYIVTNNSDTLYGEIKVYNFNRVTGNWIFNGIDLEGLHFEVSFKTYTKKRFQTFRPKDILGFGFTYKSSDYIFQRFIIVSKGIFKQEQRRYRFLSLEYQGRVSLFKDLIRVYHANVITKSDSYVYDDYYLFNDVIGLNRVEPTNDIKPLVDLLNLYGFKKDYLNTIPTKTNLKDIKMILEDYDTWCTKFN